MQRLSLHNPAAITFVSMPAKSINHTCRASINILFDNCWFYNDTCQSFCQECYCKVIIYLLQYLTSNLRNDSGE